MQHALRTVLKLWHEARPLVDKGYVALDKTLVMGLPATSMPASTQNQNSGIGSPYGKGAERVWHFWDHIIHKIMVGPVGKTSAATWHSPYLSSWNYNPFFIDLEKLTHQYKLPTTTLEKIYHRSKTDTYINFKQVEKDYTTLLTMAYQQAKPDCSFTKFCNHLVYQQMQKTPFAYIGDIPINVPAEISQRHPKWFLKDWTMGAPPDQYSPTPQLWGFPILKPTVLFNKNGKINPAGRLLKRLLRFYLDGQKGGIRIDHFIGWVDPYCFYTGTRNYPNGRLYSSPEIPPLKEYTYTRDEDFLYLAQKFLVPLFDEFHLSEMDIYPEDLGIRPLQMDYVLQTFNWGRMLPVQFNEPDNDYHLYHIRHATHKDIVVLSTHDNPRLMDFFHEIPQTKRVLFARQLAQDLRFQYNDNLCHPTWLYRMQWASALASPAHRISAFFTTITGQEGRYNIPGTLDSWHLRSETEFELGYFKALKKRQAYNPFEAIRWAIYARGDHFYQAHEELVHKLMVTEDQLFKTLQDL